MFLSLLLATKDEFWINHFSLHVAGLTVCVTTTSALNGQGRECELSSSFQGKEATGSEFKRVWEREISELFSPACSDTSVVSLA